MNLALSDEQRQIAAAVDELLARASDAARVRTVAFGGDGCDRELWAQLGEVGALGVCVPEAHGGLGLGMTELVLVAEALGRRLACVPWLESVAIAGSLLQALEDEVAASRWLPGLASGRQVYTVDIGLLDGAPVTARRERTGWRLDGLLPAVPAAMVAQRLLLPADGEDGRLLFALALEAPGVARRPRPTHDATRPVAEVRLDGARAVDADCVAVGAAVDLGLDAGRQRAAVGLAAELVGVAQQCLDLSVAYLATRVQFGRPLATFQALKHRCAQMMVAVEQARSAVLGAARQLDARPDAARRVRVAAMARCLADEAAQFCTQEAIQLHGGAGYTWDLDPQLHFKRAQASRAWLGTPAAWRERVAATLLDGEAA